MTEDMHWLGFEDETYLRLSDIEGWAPHQARNAPANEWGTRVYMRSGNWIDVAIMPEDFVERFTQYLQDTGFLPND